MALSDIDACLSATFSLSANNVTNNALNTIQFNFSSQGYNFGSFRPDLAIVRSINYSNVSGNTGGVSTADIGGGTPVLIQSSLNGKQGFIGSFVPTWNPSPIVGTNIQVTAAAQNNPGNIIDVRGKNLDSTLEFMLYQTFVNGSPSPMTAFQGVVTLTIDFIRVKSNNRLK